MNSNFLRNIMVWIIFGSLLMYVFNNIDSANVREQISYSQFRQEVLSDRVAKVVYKGDQMTITGERLDGSKFETNYPIFKRDDSLDKAIQDNGIIAVYEKVEQPSIWSQLLVGAFPILLLLGIFFFFMRQMQGGMSGKGGPMSFGKSKAKLMEGGKVKTNFQDVAGCEEAKQDVQELVDFLRDPTKFQKLGGKIPRGVLMVGPPGTGKTLLARAVAGEAKVPFFTISGSDFVEMFVGVGASRVRDMFEQAKKQSPCIVFIDEIDAVGRHRGAGLGGVRYLPGNLPSDKGTFGTRTSLEPVTPDDKASGNDGGKTIPCARGVYWRDQGKSPCEDLGTIKFRIPDGTEISNTASISRGYKSGYNIIQTGGSRGSSDGGNGGNGVTGGSAGSSSGGGGGSGYTDGSVTEVFTQDGGSTGPARINIKLSAGDYYIDDEGRILIFATNDNRDPRTLTKTTGVVNYGDNACIDDARWQRFLDLARDGTQDYRLTGTLDQSTVKITNATTKNIHKMMNGNALTLRTSLTGWVDSNYAYTLLALAWDETSNDGMSGYGSDYSILSWSPTNQYGYGFYGSSSSPFFNPTVYGYKTGINFWILPPGVPDFS